MLWAGHRQVGGCAEGAPLRGSSQGLPSTAQGTRHPETGAGSLSVENSSANGADPPLGLGARGAGAEKDPFPQTRQHPTGPESSAGIRTPPARPRARPAPSLSSFISALPPSSLLHLLSSPPQPVGFQSHRTLPQHPPLRPTSKPQWERLSPAPPPGGSSWQRTALGCGPRVGRHVPPCKARVKPRRARHRACRLRSSLASPLPPRLSWGRTGTPPPRRAKPGPSSPGPPPWPTFHLSGVLAQRAWSLGHFYFGFWRPPDKGGFWRPPKPHLLPGV